MKQLEEKEFKAVMESKLFQHVIIYNTMLFIIRTMNRINE